MTAFTELPEQRALDQGDRIAYRFLDHEERETSLTWAGMYGQARRIAALLQQTCKPSDRVVLMFPPQLEFVPAFFGSMLAGTVSIAVYPPDPRIGPAAIAQLKALIADSQPTAILGPRLVCQRVAAAVQPLRTIHVEDAAGLSPDDYRGHKPASDALVYLQYSSGSTGTPKGVQIGHDNLMAHGKQFSEGFGIGADDVCVTWLPVHHSFGLFAGVIEPTYVGCESVQMSPLAFLERPVRWLRTLSKYRGSATGGPNFAYDLCARSVTPEEVAELDLRSLRTVGFGGEPVQAATLERFAAATAPAGLDPGCLKPSLGISEGTLVITATRDLRPPLVVDLDADALEHGRVVVADAKTARRRRIVGLGHPVAGLALEIVGEPGSDIGEVWIAGPNISRGYWQRPEDTSQVFGARLPGRDGSFHRTGDLGFLLGGELFLMGRAKDLIIIRGANYHPHDIEQTAEASVQAPPQSVAAFSVEGAGGEELAVVVELQAPADEAERDRMIATIRSAVSAHHNLRCHEIAFVPQKTLPRTASQKLQRGETRRRYIARELVGLQVHGTTVVAAGTPKTVREMIARAARVAPDKLSDDALLSSLGIDSLAIVELQEQARTELGIEIPAELALDPKTRVGDLAAVRVDQSIVGYRGTPGLPDDLAPIAASFTAPSQRLLVTGATGYVGAYLLTELQKQTTSHFVCLVRAKTEAEGRERLKKAVARTNAPIDDRRVSIALGDFAQPRLGMDDATYARLAGEIDAIVHCGAAVNFIHPYSMLEGPNVGGVTEVLRFAATGRAKVVHNMSSIAVLFASGYDHTRTYPEQDPLHTDGDMPNGYERSKWIAEKNIELARARGFVISNYRIGYVTGTTQGHDFRVEEFLPSMIKGCIQLAIAPRIDTRMTMVPIDYVAASIARIISQPKTFGKTFHINHPQPITFEEAVRWMVRRGHPIEPGPFNQWRDRVAALTLAKDHDNALLPYRPFVRNLEEKHVCLPAIDCSDTLAAVAPLSCASSLDLLATYFAMFYRTGFLAPPRDAASVLPVGGAVETWKPLERL